MEKGGSDAPPPAYPAATAPPQGGAPPLQGYSDPSSQGYAGQPPAYGQPGQAGQPPPPAPGYATTQQPGTTVVIQQPGNQMFREAPVTMVCPHCRANITTSLNYENGTLTWVAAGGICLVGCWLGCCLIPLCINSLKDVKHFCPNCNKMVGSYNRM